MTKRGQCRNGIGGFWIDRKVVMRCIQGHGICEKDSEIRTARRESEVLERQMGALPDAAVSGGEQ